MRGKFGICLVSFSLGIRICKPFASIGGSLSISTQADSKHAPLAEEFLPITVSKDTLCERTFPSPYVKWLHLQKGIFRRETHRKPACCLNSNHSPITLPGIYVDMGNLP